MKEDEFFNIKYYLGENAQDNFNLLDKYQNNFDFIWIHLNSFPSGYVIININKSDLLNLDNSNDILLYGANLCKNNSKYKNLKNIKILWTTLSKIKKSNKIGEVFVSGKKNLITI